MTPWTLPLRDLRYMVPHHALKGSARASHYHVLENDAHLTPDELQRFSFDLCHLYARATKIVSRPAPVYYAHRAAFLAQYYNDNYREDNLFEVGSTSSHGSAASSASTCSTLAGNTDKTVYFA